MKGPLPLEIVMPKKKGKYYGTAFRISQEAHDLVRLVAAAQRTSMSECINSLIMLHLRPLATEYVKRFTIKEEGDE